MMKKSIVWFKTDLRLHDNEALTKAIESSEAIIPVYCFDDEHFRKTEYGFDKTGSFRAQFLLDSLQNLDANLRKLGSGLVVLKGKPEIELSKIINEFDISTIIAKKEVAFEEKQTEARVEKEIWKQKCKLETYSTSTLYHAEDLPFSIKNIPDVFTTFRKKIEHESEVRNVIATPTKIKSPPIAKLNLPTLNELGLSPQSIDSRAAYQFKGGETAGLERLKYYTNESEFISTYKNTRDQLIGANYSSKFSPWLALGCLSPKQIYYQIKQHETIFGSNESTYWLVFELMWRDYFRFMMKKHNQKFFLQSGIKDVIVKNEKSNITKLNKWINGETKVDFIDANMLELKHTGFMSNRGRQNVASYLCNDLQIDWRYGAAYFEQQLIDYDVCSNWGNWAYLAGVGNDPRGKRYFDIDKQVNKYDPENKYQKLWITKH